VAILEIERRDARRRIDEAGDAAHGLRRLPLALDPSGDAFFHMLGDLLGMLDELLLVDDLALQICEIAFDPRPLRRVLCAREIALGIGKPLTQRLEHALRRSPPTQMAAYSGERHPVVASAINVLP